MVEQNEKRQLTLRVKTFVAEAGADIVVVVSVDHLENVLPTEKSPSACLSPGEALLLTEYLFFAV